MSIQRCQQSPSWNRDEPDKPPQNRRLSEVKETLMHPSSGWLLNMCAHTTMSCIPSTTTILKRRSEHKFLKQRWFSEVEDWISWYSQTDGQAVDLQLYLAPLGHLYYSTGTTFWVLSKHIVQFPSRLFCNAYAQFASWSVPDKKTNGSQKAIKSCRLTELMGLYKTIGLLLKY